MNYTTYEKKITDSLYPGRGIVIGKTPNGKNIVQVYWIMGRSDNSRNRIFEKDGGYIRTKAFDESKLIDSSLVIYYPIKYVEENHIVTNGNQTETIVEFLKKGSTFEEALKTREFEPDPPNYTPRISGIVNVAGNGYKLSILKTAENNEELGQRNFFAYDKYINGAGHCITTYSDDGNPLPSFNGEPYLVKVFNDIIETTKTFWDYLNKDNRVSLLVKHINVKTGKTEFEIINKNI